MSAPPGTDGWEGAVGVIVADDHPLFRAALAEAIESDQRLRLLDVAGDGHEALEKILSLDPAVAVLDMRMPGLDGENVARRLRGRGYEGGILFVSEYHEGERVLAALSVGGNGYLSKAATAQEICAAIHQVAEGSAVMGGDVGGDVARALGSAGELTKLTEREQAILELIAEGETAPEIAVRLGIAVPTVKTHTQHLYSKLEVNDRAAAVAAGMRRGLLS